MYWYMEVMRKYAVFSGRSRRKEYWMFQLVNIVIFVVLLVGFVTELHSPMAGIFIVLFCAYLLATIIPNLAVAVRRLHDVNFSGWWMLIALIPAGGTVLLVFHLLDSTPGPNRYGPNPKSGEKLGYGSAYPPYRSQSMTPYGSQPMTRAAGAGAALPGSQGALGFCSVCGTSMPAGSRFCPKCGRLAP